jgi:hypothetical protein
MNPAIGEPLFRIKTIGEVVHSIKRMEEIIFFPLSCPNSDLSFLQGTRWFDISVLGL